MHRRNLTIFFFFLLSGMLGTYTLLHKPIESITSEPPEDTPILSEHSIENNAEPTYLTSYPCDCDGDRLLSLTEPWLREPIVGELQKILQTLGEYTGGIDSTFGPKTARAVANFKAKRNLPPDSEVDLPTWQALADSVLPVAAEKTPPPPGEVRLKIDVSARTLTVYSDEVPYKTYPVAVGKDETPSPLGYFSIVSKERWGGGFGTRWMQLNTRFGKYGIHGTNKPWSIGRFESAGCIRMHNRHVEELYNWVKIGTRVLITSGPWSEIGNRPLLRRGGIRGSAVLAVQRELEHLGYLKGVDGIYGLATEDAVKRFQKDHNLPQTGEVNRQTYDALGLFYFE